MRYFRKKHRVPVLNTTSTADISFMLLIFFLVTTSMDVDKGLLRQLPSPEPQKQQQASLVDQSTLLRLRVTADGKLLMNDQPVRPDRLQQEVLRFVHRLGSKHLISIESDREACYDLYFQMQNQLMLAYGQWRDEYALKHYGKRFSLLGKEDKEKVRQACPQRITESYANAQRMENKSVSADAEEKQGEDKAEPVDKGKEGNHE